MYLEPPTSVRGHVQCIDSWDAAPIPGRRRLLLRRLHIDGTGGRQRHQQQRGDQGGGQKTDGTRRHAGSHYLVLIDLFVYVWVKVAMVQSIDQSGHVANVPCVGTGV